MGRSINIRRRIIKNPEKEDFSFLHLLPQAALVCDLKGKIIECNELFASALDHRSANLSGQSLFTLLHFQLPEGLHKSEVLGQIFPFEQLLLKNKAGQALLFQLRVMELENEQERLVAYLLLLEKVSADAVQKQAHTDEQLRGLHRVNTGNLITISKDKIITYASPALEKLCGYTPENLIHKKLTHIIDPEEVVAFEQEWQKLLRGEKDAFELKISLQIKSGGFTWVLMHIADLSGFSGIGGIIVNIINIDRLERANRALKWSKERFRLATIATNDVVWDWKPGETKLSWGENFDKVFGFRPGEDINELDSWTRRIHPEERERVIRSFLDLELKDDMQWEQHYRFLKADGQYAVVRDRGFTVRDSKGEEMRVIGAMQDITRDLERERQLRNSEEKFRKLFERSLVGIGMVSPETGRWLDFNQALLNMLGYSREEFAKMSYSEITPEVFWTQDQEQLQILMDNGSYGPYQKKFIRKDQQEIKVILSGFLAVMPNGTKVGWNHIMDISQIEKSNLALQDAEQRFRNFMDHASDAFMILNEEGKYEFVSPNIERIMGFKPEEFLNKDNFHFIHPEDHQLVAGRFEKALEDFGSTQRSSFRAKHKNGGYVWVEVNGRFLRDQYDKLVAYLVVRSKKPPREEIEANLRKLSWVADKTTNAVLITNAQEQIEWVNQSFTAFSGYTLKEAIGKTPSELLHGQASEETYQTLIKKNLASGKPFRAEIINYHKDGHKYWIETYVTPVFNDNGELTNFIAIENNISERKEKEAALRESLDLSEKQNERLQNFTHIVSHNFRAHASNIMGIAGELQQPAGELAKKELIELLDSSAKHLMQALDNLNEILQLQGTRELALKEVAVKPLVDCTVALLKKEFENAQAQLTVDINDDFTLYFYPAYLESIIYNLLSNALRYRSPGRPLRISMETEVKERFKLMRVKDNGQGIDLKNYGNDIFGMYKTFHHHPESKGLGLFLIKNQLNALGGDIKVKSSPGKGSTFELTFPKQGVYDGR